MRERGALVDYSSRRLAVVNERVRALLPTSLAEFQAAPAAPVATHRELSDFVFTWAFFWHDGEKFQSATFENMPCRVADDHNGITGYAFEPTADPTGLAALTPHLKRSQDHVFESDELPYFLGDEFYDSWDARAMLICTRKRDGVAVEMARFEALDRENGYEEDSTRGRISFFESQFDCPGIHNGEISANLLFEKETGTLTNMYSNFYPVIEEVQMSPELLRAICHAKCDAVEATPLS